MTLYETITQQLKKTDKVQLLKKIGYNNVPNGRNTLDGFLNVNSIYQWLKESHFDMKYSSEQFLKALLEELALYNSSAIEEIELIKEKQLKITKMKIPYIYIDTHFIRKGEPIIILAAMEGSRRIILDREEIVNLPFEEILERVSLIIKEHYKSSGGKLPWWGMIETYVYCHTDSSRYLFDGDSEIIDSNREILESRATLKIGNQEIRIGDI